jgi:hypothetical protein
MISWPGVLLTAILVLGTGPATVIWMRTRSGGAATVSRLRWTGFITVYLGVSGWLVAFLVWRDARPEETLVSIWLHTVTTTFAPYLVLLGVAALVLDAFVADWMRAREPTSDGRD